MNGNGLEEEDVFPIVGKGWAFPIKPVPSRPLSLSRGAGVNLPGSATGAGGGEVASRNSTAGSPKRGLLRWLSGEDKIRQSIWIILSTAPGERLMRPDFGCGIQELVFKPNTGAFRGIVREKVMDALLRYEPRIDVIEVAVTTPYVERNRMDIRIDYRLRANNAFFNIVYPFYLKEGVGAAG